MERGLQNHQHIALNQHVFERTIEHNCLTKSWYECKSGRTFGGLQGFPLLGQSRGKKIIRQHRGEGGAVSDGISSQQPCPHSTLVDD